METSAHESPQTIYVRTLGGFSITVDGKEINDNSNQSKKPWSLLEYLVVVVDLFTVQCDGETSQRSYIYSLR